MRTESLAAIDVHVHIEADGHGHHSMDDELLAASARYFRASHNRTPALASAAPLATTSLSHFDPFHPLFFFITLRIAFSASPLFSHSSEYPGGGSAAPTFTSRDGVTRPKSHTERRKTCPIP